MGYEKINPFIAGQTRKPVTKKEETVVEQPKQQPAEPVDVKAKPAAGNEQPVATVTDSEFMKKYLNVDIKRGIELDPEFAAVLGEVLPDKVLAGVKRYNAIANETRIKATQERFEETAPEARVDDEDARALLSHIPAGFRTPEQRMSIALATAEFESLV